MRSPDQDLDLWMARLLQAGVLIATFTMVVGGALYLAGHGAETADYHKFHGIQSGQDRAYRVLRLGVLFMIATPVLRVVYSVGAFARERDWLYTSISAVVLSLLAYSFWVR